MEKMKENGVKIPIVEESLMHIIYTGFFSSVFQIIEHDIDRETAKKNVPLSSDNICKMRQ